MSGAVLVLATGLYFAAHQFWASARTPAAVIPGEVKKWKLEVINASGQIGAAQRITDILRRNGFDVIDVRTQRAPIIERSLILDRVGGCPATSEIAAVMAMPEDRIQVQLDKSLLLDVSILLGKDHRSFTRRTE